MAKVIVYPPTSMILSDLVDRMGHKALVVPEVVRKLATDNNIASPPLNVTSEEPKRASLRGGGCPFRDPGQNGPDRADNR